MGKKSKVIVIHPMPQTYHPGIVPQVYYYPAGSVYTSPQPTGAYGLVSPYTTSPAQARTLIHSASSQYQQPGPVELSQYSSATNDHGRKSVGPHRSSAGQTFTHAQSPSTSVRQTSQSEGHQSLPSSSRHNYDLSYDSQSSQSPSINVGIAYYRLQPRDRIIRNDTSAEEDLTRLDRPDPPRSLDDYDITPYSHVSSRTLRPPAPLHRRPRCNSTPHTRTTSSRFSESVTQNIGYEPQPHPSNNTSTEAVEVIDRYRSSLLQDTTLRAPEADLPSLNSSSVVHRVTFDSKSNHTLLYDPKTPVSNLMRPVSLPKGAGPRSPMDWQQHDNGAAHTDLSTYQQRKGLEYNYILSGDEHHNDGERYRTSNQGRHDHNVHHRDEEENRSSHQHRTYNTEGQRQSSRSSPRHSYNYLQIPPTDHSPYSTISSLASSPEPQTPETFSTRRSHVLVMDSGKSRHGHKEDDEVERRCHRCGYVRSRGVRCCDEHDEDVMEERESLYVRRSPGESSRSRGRR